MQLGTFLRINDISEADGKFKELAGYGFTSCQLVYKPETYKSEDARVIKDAAEKYAIDISAMFCGYKDMNMVWDNFYGYQLSGLNIEAFRMSRMEYIKSAANFANEAGIEDIIIHAGFIPNNPFAPEYFTMLTSLELLCAHCKTLGMNVLLETGGESAVALLRTITDLGRDNLFINLDPANMLMYGYANPVDSLYTIGKYVRNIHGKDGCPPTDPRILGEEKAVGEGMVDFEKMLTKLHELGYDRYITIEREITGEKQIEDILKAKKYFEKLLDKIYV
ncbi:MAG: sugar phosphate isomerase/epimerase [Clostridia bacterium]|nr:sugar phosphate isomerase/epimerase [Clostridia bacterium]